MTWKRYAVAMMWFNILGLLAVCGLQRAQRILPLDPQGFAGVGADSSFNTAVSFASNTNWQGYSGEAAMSYLTQMVALTVQNFVSAAAGMATLVALIRGFRQRSAALLGNFWVDLVRGTLHILLPLSLVLALLLVSQGVVQNLRPYQSAQLVEATSDADGKPVTEQVLPMGLAASQIAIKQLGANGGGFFNVNSAHPFENPTPLSNFLEVLAILLIPAALCYMFDLMVKDTRQGWALLAAMTLLFVPLLVLCLSSEQAGNPRLAGLGVDQVASAGQAGGNMEGKEVRFGIANSALWAAGLMVGRMPEYLGKEIEAFEMKMASLIILIPCAAVLCATALAIATETRVASLQDHGPHGFSEILYAFSSMGNNNGSAFGGLSANVPFYNLLGGAVMFISRYWLAIPILAIAGSLAAKEAVPQSAGALPTHTPLFRGSGSA